MKTANYNFKSSSECSSISYILSYLIDKTFVYGGSRLQLIWEGIQPALAISNFPFSENSLYFANRSSNLTSSKSVNLFHEIQVHFETVKMLNVNCNEQQNLNVEANAMSSI